MEEGLPASLGAATSHVFVADDVTLNKLCDFWSGMEYVAMDTEFIRTSTFFPKAGLIQICDGEANYLIDPLAISDWKAFRALLIDPRVTKIFHSCSEDLLVFLAFLGVVPEPVFDTQIAAAFLDERLSLSYQNLVRERMGIDLPKGETRSDWLQRPLTDEQLLYAALDVVYLPEIHRLQAEELVSQGKMEWFLEDCERLVRQFDSEMAGDYSEAWLNLKGAWQLSRRQLAALQRLAQWREERARKRDKPRNWIVKDLQLLAIARLMPQSRQQLQTVPELGSNFVKYEGETVLQLVREARELPPEELPEPLPRPLTGEQKERLRAAQKFIQEKADALRMSPDILARKRLLMALYLRMLQLGPLPPEELADRLLLDMPGELRGWRRELLLEDLIDILAERQPDD